jgi:hypothetical protein
MTNAGEQPHRMSAAFVGRRKFIEKALTNCSPEEETTNG